MSWDTAFDQLTQPPPSVPPRQPGGWDAAFNEVEKHATPDLTPEQYGYRRIGQRSGWDAAFDAAETPRPSPAPAPPPEPQPAGNALAEATARQAQAQAQANAAQNTKDYEAARTGGLLDFEGDKPGSLTREEWDRIAPGSGHEENAANLIAAPKTAEQFAAEQAQGEGPSAAFTKRALGGLARPVQGVVGLVDPEAARSVNLTYATSGENPISETAGGAVGGLANVPLVMAGPAGLATSALAAGGNERADIAARRAAGEDISGPQEVAGALGAGGVDLASNLAALKVLGAANQVGGGFVGKAAANAAGNVALGRATGAANNAVQQATTNAAPQDSGSVGGDVAAALQGVGFTGVHSLLGARAKQAELWAPHEPTEQPNVPPPVQENTAPPVRDRAAILAENQAMLKQLQDREAQSQALLKSGRAVLGQAEPEPAKPGLFTRLLTEEGGGLAPTQEMVDLAQGAADKVREVGTAVDRSMNLGLRTVADAEQTGRSIRAAVGNATAEGHKFEAALAPHRPAFDKLPDTAPVGPSKAAVHAEIEGGLAAGDPAMQPAYDIIRQKGAENAARAKALGLRNLDEAGDNLARLFEFPNSPTGGKSLAGNNSPFRGRKFDSYADALAAAKAAGGRERYSNPLDAQMARQYLVEQNLAARENLRGEEDRGTARWVPGSTAPPDTHNVPLQDRLLGTEARDLILPKWQVAKILNLPTAEGVSELDKMAASAKAGSTTAQLLRPGDPVPDGYAKTGRQESGQYHMDADHAAMFNSFASTPPTDPVANLALNAMRAGVKFRYDLNGTHMLNGYITGVAQQVQNAIGRALGGDFKAAASSAVDALTGGIAKGVAFNRRVRAGNIGDVEQRVLDTGLNFHPGSITDPDVWKPITDAFAANKPITGTALAIKTALHTVPHDAVFHKVLANILAGHAVTAAENQVKSGVGAKAGQAQLIDSVETLAKAIGKHDSIPGVDRDNFARQLANFVFPAAGFVEGQARVGAGALRGHPAALALTATTAGLTAAIGAVINRALTGEWPKNLEDALNPRTGGSQNGHATRLNLPGLASRLSRFAGGANTGESLNQRGTNALGELKSSINPMITGGIETALNKDWQGNQVRPDDASTVSNVGRGLYHTLKGGLPSTVLDTGEKLAGVGQKTWGDVAAGFVGERVSHPVTSEAEQIAYDALHESGKSGGRNLEEQRQRDEQAKWTQAITRGGADAQTARQEMLASPDMDSSLRKSIERRAKEATAHPDQPLASLVHDRTLHVETLAKMWDAATGAERARIKSGLGERVGIALHESGKSTPAERMKWLALKAKLGG